MKAILFAVMTTLATSASAADSIYVTTELTRNGETVDDFSTPATYGVTRPHRSVEFIKYRESITAGKVKTADLEVGTTGSITPVLIGESIGLRFDVNYVRLMQMDKAKVGNTYIDLPKTAGFQLSTTDIFSNGEKREYRSSENGVEYIYTVSATKQ